MSTVKQPHFKSSLALRLTLYIVGSAVFIALVVGSSLIYLQTQTLYDNQCQSMAAINQRIAEVVQEVIRDSQSLLYMVVQDDCFQEMNIQRIKNYFTRARQRFPDFVCFCLLDKNGHEILRAGAGPHSYPLGEGPFNKQVITALQNGDTESYIGPVFVKQNRPMTNIVATIHNDKGLVGMIYTTLDISKYSTLLSTVKIGGGEGYAYIVDKKGYVIAHSDFRHVLKSEKWSEVASVKDIMSGIDHAHNFKSDQYRAWDGRKVIGVHTKIQPMGWGVIVEQPLASVYAPIKRTVIKTILWLLAAIGILIALTLYLSRRITRPILTLKEGTQEFANGNWEVFFDFKTGDEIQALGEALLEAPVRAAREEEARRQAELSALYSKGMEALAAQDWLGARKLLAQIQEMEPGYRDVGALLSQAQAGQARAEQLATLLARGKERLGRGEWSQAAEAYRQALALAPDHPEALARLAEAERQEKVATLFTTAQGHLKAGRWSEAIVGFQAVLKLAPAHAEAARQLAEAQAQLERQEAEERARREEEARQAELARLYAVADEAAKARNWSKAIECFQAVLKLDASYRDAPARLAQVQEALAAEEATRQRAAQLARLYTQALEHLQAERWQEAIEGFRAVLEVAPTYKDATALLAEAKHKKELASLPKPPEEKKKPPKPVGLPEEIKARGKPKDLPR